MYKGKKIVALIQVRLASSRLPNKALINIGGKTLIERVVDQIKRSKYTDEVIVATSDENDNLPLINFLKEKRINYYAGNLLNIVDRFINAAMPYEPNIIVRVTGDSPFVSYEMIDLYVESHVKNNVDYTSSDYGILPTGVLTEIISFSSLKNLNNFNLDFNYTEYMTYYFRNNPSHFKIKLIDVPRKYKFPQYRVTLDYKEDLELVEQITIKLEDGNKESSLENIISVLQENPSLSKINSNIGLIFKTDKNLIAEIKKATTIKNPIF